MYVYSLPRDLAGLLGRDEKVVWCGKPVFAPLILKNLLFMLFGIPFLVFPLIVFGFAWNFNFGFNVGLLFFFVFWYGIAGLITFGPFLYVLLSWKNMYYLITNKRVILRTGVVGIDYEILSLDNVQEVSLNTDFWDKMYGTGTIVLHSVGVKPLTLFAVKDPTYVLNVLRRIIDERKSSA